MKINAAMAATAFTGSHVTLIAAESQADRTHAPRLGEHTAKYFTIENTEWH